MSEPTFHFIVVVDIEGFGARTIPFQESLTDAMYDVVRTALTDVHIDPAAVVQLDRGDGIIMLVPTTAANSVTLAGRFVSAVDDALREKARFHSADHRMRLRMALHQGNCHRKDDRWVGAAINTAARLVDAAPLRAALTAAPDAAMSFIVSDEIYQGVVRHGYRGMEPQEFAPVDLEVKELRERAWVQVPGRSYPPGIPAAGAPPGRDAAAERDAADPDRDATDPDRDAAGTAPANTGTVSGGQFNGGFHGTYVGGGQFGGDFVQGHKYVDNR
ncbi:hypothetical protein [Actinoplanes sp. DH11]|uniref:hypothetical protein n=1 Tax=Actinoplanes sp. DH11 TaxID=2857011 RepID=UPI001E321FE1|nr:hypothetical protein [Actinoplanes sp. DH11]